MVTGPTPPGVGTSMMVVPGPTWAGVIDPASATALTTMSARRQTSTMSDA